jgi:hypothetical protein
VPRDDRSSYEYLGDWVGRGWRGQAAKELHVVQASRAVINEYRGSKRILDGGALVEQRRANVCWFTRNLLDTETRLRNDS